MKIDLTSIGQSTKRENLNLSNVLNDLSSNDHNVREAKMLYDKELSKRKSLHLDIVSRMSGEPEFARFLKIDIAAIRREVHPIRRNVKKTIKP